jgi:lipoyl(octanoyl) transferase
VRTLERALVDALTQEGIRARARVQDGPDYTGVWVQERKIASIGVHVARGVTTHGFAVNVDNDLAPFSWVVACGLPGVTMTSLAAEKHGRDGDDRPPAAPLMDGFRTRTVDCVARALARRPQIVSPARLQAALNGTAAPA